MTSDLKAMLAAHWRALDEAPIPSSGKLRVASLPVKAATGSLNAAVDAAGIRHLLIPLGAAESVAPTTDTALRWRLRPLGDRTGYRRYADLGCHRGELNDVFTDLCVDILVSVETNTARPLKTARRVVERWRALFTALGDILSADQLAGLFGELLILSRLLDIHGEATRLWTGPTGHRHDFHGGIGAVEVKTSTSIDGRRVRIHGLDQLEEPSGGFLALAWLRLEKSSDQGRTLPELVDDLMNLVNDDHDLTTRLTKAGYRPADRDQYGALRFHLAEQRWFPVDSAFPRLTESMIAPAVQPSVRDVSYIVDLMPDPVPQLTDDQIRDRLVDLTRSL